MLGQHAHERDEVASGRALVSEPASPTELLKRSWWAVLKRTMREFSKDNLTDWAAALTYYSVLSIFPFMRASNAIYEMPEGRPVWKTVPLRVGLTLAVVVLLALPAVGIVATGVVADRAGQMLGIGSTGVLVWDIAKWPVIAALVSLVFALLYWASPNVKHPGFRWLSPGGVLAVVVWVLASAGFAFYVANFGSYNKTSVRWAG